MSRQLLLNIQQPVSKTFKNYVLPNAGSNSQIVTTLESVTHRDATLKSKASSIFLWGPTGCGKTHLLQACACEARNNNLDSIYLPLQELGLDTFEILQGLDQYSVICIDDLEVVASNDRWEQALFHLYNQAQMAGSTLIFSAAYSPRNLEIVRPELTTRLGWGTVYQLTELNDTDKKKAIRFKATELGFDLSNEVVNYMLRHYHRDNHRLFSLLHRLDEHALADHRKNITVPFLKQVFASEM